jgi:hypothetical protein
VRAAFLERRRLVDGGPGDADAQQMTTRTLGGATNTWGRTWTPAELSNANFRVRVVNAADSTSRDFSLDWIAVRVTY